MENILTQVVEITEETPLIRSIRIVRVDGKPLGPYLAGAHIDVVGPTQVLRQYSLCSPPSDPTSLLIAVKLEGDSKGGSEALHQVEVGDHLKISEPRNLLYIDRDADRHLLVAGGVGVTPLLSMSYELFESGAEFELHYFVRNSSDVAFRSLLEDRAEFKSRVRIHVGVPRSKQPEILANLSAGLTPSSAVYTCGPENFMDQVKAAFSPTVGEGNIHVEYFVAESIDTTGDAPFTVELDTGEAFEIPADRSILSVLEENGIEVFKSCEEGVCGSCVSGVLSGTPEHRDHCLSVADRASNTQMALCVSRARSEKLVIELY